MQKKQITSKSGSRATITDKRNDTGQKEFKSKEDQLLSHVKEYLQCMGYNRTFETLKSERPSSKNPNTNRSLANGDNKKQMLLHFERGSREQLFKGIGKLFTNEAAHLKLQFELYIYFTVLPILTSKSSTTDKQSGEAFKRYIQVKGNQIANISQLLCYFALPHASRPQDVSAYAEVFKKGWVVSLRASLQSFLSSVLRPAPNRKSCFLLDSFASMHPPQDQCKENCKHIVEGIELQQHISQLSRTLDLLKSSLQQIKESSATNMRESNEKWFTFGKDLFMLLKRTIRGEKVRLDKYQHFFSGTIDELLQANDISLFDKNSEEYSISPDLVKKDKKAESFALFPIDLLKVKRVMRDSQKETEACIVLRGLRNRVMKQKSTIERREVIIQYERHDVLGVYENPIAVLFSNPVRRFTLRLMETLVNEEYGIQYLIKSRGLIANMTALLATDSQNRSVLLSILQRFSYLKVARGSLIEEDIIAKVFHLLQEEQFDEFDTHYIMGLFMNLSMTRKSLPKFQMFANELVQLFLRMHAHSNADIRNSTNGTFYLVLLSPVIVEEAKRNQIHLVLQRMLEGCQEESVHQYEYILKRINGKEQIQIDSDEEEEEEWEEEGLSLQYDQEYVEGEQQFPAGDQLLFRQYALLGPLAVKEHLLTRSKLEETQKKRGNLTTSIINKSRRFDNIFVNKQNVTALQPELRELLQKR